MHADGRDVGPENSNGNVSGGCNAMCYPYEPDHIKHAFWSLALVAVVVVAVIAITTWSRPSLEAQYQARCIAGNICEVPK